MSQAFAMSQLDAYWSDYEPYRKDPRNPKHSQEDADLLYLTKSKLFSEEKKTSMCKKINDWLKDKVKAPKEDSPIVIAVAPGHKEDSNPDGFMHGIARTLLDSLVDLEDGTQQLIRTKTIEKQATSGGVRSMETHNGTIGTKGNPNNKGKVVIILDDFWTSGCTLNSCKKVMETTNPKAVKLIVLGKTVPKPVPKPYLSSLTVRLT